MICASSALLACIVFSQRSTASYRRAWSPTGRQYEVSEPLFEAQHTGSEGNREWHVGEGEYDDGPSDELHHLDSYGQGSNEASGWQDWRSWGPVDEWQGVAKELQWLDTDETGLKRSVRYRQSASGRDASSSHATINIDKSGVEQRKTSLISDILSRPAMPDPYAQRQDERQDEADERQVLLSGSDVGSNADKTQRARRKSHKTQDTEGSQPHPAMEGLDAQSIEWLTRMNTLYDPPQDQPPLNLRTRHRRMRMIMEEIWEARGITLDLLPEELALEMARLKIEFGHAMSLGLLASTTVRNSKEKKYFHRYQLFTKRYSSKLYKLRSKLKEDAS